MECSHFCLLGHLAWKLNASADPDEVFVIHNIFTYVQMAVMCFDPSQVFV
jgi:hypothetical protein